MTLTDDRAARAADELQAEVREWTERETGGRIVRAERPELGGSRDLYLLDVERPDGSTLDLVLRLESGGTFVGTPISLHREAAVYRALGPTEVPTPQLVAFAQDGSALLVNRLAGTADFHTLAADQQARVYLDFVGALAKMHNLDPDALELDGFARPETPEDHARLDLAVWAELLDHYVDEPDPLILYAQSWLDANAPTSVQRTVLVQGDTGPGNFLCEDGRVTGIVDWEFAHLGDPMDDLAWLDYRTGVFAADLDTRPALDAYARMTGLTIDPDRIDYYRIMVEYRCAVTTSLAVARGGGTRGFAPYVIQRERYLATLGKVLCRRLRIDQATIAAEDTEATEIMNAPPDSPRSPWYDRIREGLREAVRGIPDPELRERTRNLQILLQRLRAFDVSGRDLERVDREDRGATLGIPADDASALRRHAFEAGKSGDESTLRYLVRREQREAALWGSMMLRKRP